MEQALLASANASGGWGYYAGHGSRLEPTCWALLALLPAHPSLGEPSSVHGDFIRRSQRRDGLFVEGAVSKEDRPNLAFNALAAILLEHHGIGIPDARERVLSALIQHKGMKLDPSEINQQNNSLQGWGWVDDTFSWVEPTAWCLLALKKATPKSAQASARIEEAERLLVDRCCDVGGWNYGNSNMLGQMLHPFVSTTAGGLLALQDRRQDPCVVRSLEFLVKHRLAERSAMGLGLALIALRVFDAPFGDVREALLAQWERTKFLGNAHLTAVALYALRDQPAQSEALHV